LIRNSFYNIAGSVFRLAINFLSIPIIIRFIGIEEYGLWSLVSTIVAFASLLECGLTSSIIVFLSKDISVEDSKGASETLTITSILLLCLSFLIVFCLWFASPFIITHIPSIQFSQHSSLIYASQLGGVFVFFNILQRLPIAIEQVYQRYGKMNLINTFYLAFNTLGLSVVAWLGGHSVEMMQWQILTNIIFLSVHCLFAWWMIKDISPNFCWSFKKASEITKYSLASWSTVIVSSLFCQGDRLIIAFFLGARSLGIYAAISNIVSQIPAVASVPVQPLVPKLVGILDSESKECKAEIRTVVGQALQLNVLISVIIGSSALAFSNSLVNITVPGVAVSESIPVMQVMTIIYTLYAMNVVGFNILLTKRVVMKCLLNQVISTILCLGLIVLGAKMNNLLLASLGNVGYLGTLGMLVMGMRELEIRATEWLSNLLFPVLCFMAAATIFVILPGSFFVKEIVLLLEISILFIWFFKKNPSILLHFSQNVSS
jgi:O-antigen/teichoic acid export membrane protein